MIKETLKNILYREKSSSEKYIEYLKNTGMRIGGGTVIYYPRNCVIDETRPWLIEIGKNVKITYGVTILTHGYDWSVLKNKYGDILGSAGKVTIGDNVFIGTNSTILKGVTIGNNVIIGANSLVNKDVPDNVVVAGNPAKVICTVEDYYKKRQKAQLQEAIDLTIEYYKVYNKWPDKQILREFIFLFEDRNEKNIKENEVFNEIGSLNGTYEITLERFLNTKGEFKSYDDFISYCEKQIK